MLLAETRQARSEFDDAELILNRALLLRQEAFGENHAETVAVYLQLGDLAKARGNTDQAIQSYQQGEALLRQAGEQTHALMEQFRERIALVTHTQ